MTKMTQIDIQYRTLFRSLLVGLVVGSSIFSCSSDPNKRPSPLKSDTTKVGQATMTIHYSSPAVKGRKIFGPGNEYLVPYDEVWRTGANDATYLTLDQNIMIDSFPLDAGRYSIFTIPNRKEWTVIVNKEWDQWGSYGYNQKKDVFRKKVKVSYLEQPIERMKLFFSRDSLHFTWDRTRWSIPLHSTP